jgi:hypothetical protein
MKKMAGKFLRVRKVLQSVVNTYIRTYVFGAKLRLVFKRIFEPTAKIRD